MTSHPAECPLVSVVVPVRDDPRILDCVTSILALRDEVERLEVVVVDHLSTDDFRAHVLSLLPPEVCVIPFAGPTVYGARNAGVEASSGEIVLFTDADCVARAGWLAEAMRGLARGAEIVQGFSGSAGRSRIDLLVQRRYEAHLRGLATGDPTECDTRNLAVHRRVFEHVRFPGDWRRTGDTYFGLVAEAEGFRVAYCPAMRVDHAHEPDLPLFAAKQIAHGWGAQRLMRERPDVRWHGGHLALVARVSRWTVRFPGQRLFASLLARAAILSAAALQRSLPVVPLSVATLQLAVVDKTAGLAGHLLFESTDEEPRPSAFLRREVVRD